MQRTGIAAVFCTALSPAWADCESELGLLRAGLAATDFQIVEPGKLSEENRRCRLSGLSLAEGATLKIDIKSMSWVAEGFEALMAGTPEKLSLDLIIDNARVIPQTTDPWMSYYLELQNRINFIDVAAAITWNPSLGVMNVEQLSIDLPGKNGFWLSSRVTGATADMMPGRISEFGALELESMSVAIENEGYLDGLALGWMLGQLSSLPGDPEAVTAATLGELKKIVAAWPDDIFPPDSKAALARLIDAGPLPWGRLELTLESGAIPLNRFLVHGTSPQPLSADAMANMWAGAVIGVDFEPSDEPE